MTSLSVIICTHNPRKDYLQKVLDALKVQTLPRERWELLLVDNVSKEPLAKLWDLTWHPNGRHILEKELGLTPARLRGITEARSQLLIFIDDDNVVALDYLERAVALAKAHPAIGVFGAGMLEPEFEANPPSLLVPRLHMLALRQVSKVKQGTNPRINSEAIPWGAGLCATRQVAEHYQVLISQLNISSVLGRRPQQLFCGEDDVFSWAAVSSGSGFAIFPELQVTHLISSGRLTESYFVRLTHDHAFSHGVLNYLCDGTRNRGFGTIQYTRLLFHGIRRGLFSMRCRWAESRGMRGANRFISEQRLCPLNILTATERGSEFAKNKSHYQALNVSD